MDVDAMEKLLRPPLCILPSFPPKEVILDSGEKMVIRQARREEARCILDILLPLFAVSEEYYDIVAARMYAEILGWARYRVVNEFVLIGTVDDVVVGITNGRQVTPKLGMSLHTLAISRGQRIGAILFAAKMEYQMDVIGCDEVFVVAESPIGFRRWMKEYQLEDRSKEFPEVRHELGGVPTYSLTKKLWRQAAPSKCKGMRPTTLRTSTMFVVPGFCPKVHDVVNLH